MYMPFLIVCHTGPLKCRNIQYLNVFVVLHLLVIVHHSLMLIFNKISTAIYVVVSIFVVVVVLGHYEPIGTFHMAMNLLLLF